MSKLTINFSSSEFACPCCNKEVFYISHIMKLQNMHDHFSKKYKKEPNFVKIIIRVTSGYRCKKHNKEVYLQLWAEKTPKQRAKFKDFDNFYCPGSQHTKGTATDIKVYVIYSDIGKVQIPPKIIYEYADKHFKGVGSYKRFTHCDSRRNKARW